jgi:hypothetical protein
MITENTKNLVQKNEMYFSKVLEEKHSANKKSGKKYHLKASNIIKKF